MKITKFQDLECWKASRELVNMVYQIVDKNTKLRNDFRFKNQFSSSAVSVMSNIAEGFSRQSNKEFMQFLYISKGSIAELQSLCYVAQDIHYFDKESFDKIFDQAEIVAKLISKLITYLRNKLKS